MMSVHSKAIFAIVFAAAGVICEGATALEAVKLLPKAQARKLARIEAREATLEPDRWYLLVHDEDDEKGVREFVVAGKELVTTRPISQFAETLTEEEVIGRETIRIDSARALEIAQQYAEANDVTPVKVNYALRREEKGSPAVWTITCLDEAGAHQGAVVLTANKGTVLSHDGFTFVPASKRERTKKLEVDAAPLIHAPETDEALVASEEEDDSPAATGESKKRHTNRSENGRSRPSVRGTLRTVRGKIRRLLPF